MSKTTDQPQALYHTKMLTDDAYKQLLRQKEVEERPERAKQRIRNYEDGQLMKYSFFVGFVVGAGIIIGLQQLWDLLQ